MDLVISSFVSMGDVLKERLVLKATDDVDIGGYSVFAAAESSKGDGVQSGKVNAYWFPDLDVKKDDLIVLYTKKGSRSKKELAGNRTAWFFYWGCEEAIWKGKIKRRAVLVEVLNWTSEAPQEQAPSE